jgi:hypothetical protein
MYIIQSKKSSKESKLKLSKIKPYIKFQLNVFIKCKKSAENHNEHQREWFSQKYVKCNETQTWSVTIQYKVICHISVE